jgi:hypothetical protein
MSEIVAFNCAVVSSCGVGDTDIPVSKRLLIPVEVLETSSKLSDGL